MTIYCMKISYLRWINKLETIVSFRYLLDMSSLYSIPTCLSHSPPTSSPCYNPKWAKPGNYMSSPLGIHERRPPTTLEGRGKRSHRMLPQPLRAGRCLWQAAVMGFPLLWDMVGECPTSGCPHPRAVAAEIFELPAPQASLWEHSLRYWRWQRPQRPPPSTISKGSRILSPPPVA